MAFLKSYGSVIRLFISLVGVAGCKMRFVGKTSPVSLSIPDTLTLSGPLSFQAGICSSAFQVGGLVSKTGENVNLPALAEVVVGGANEQENFVDSDW